MAGTESIIVPHPQASSRERAGCDAKAETGVATLLLTLFWPILLAQKIPPIKPKERSVDHITTLVTPSPIHNLTATL